MSLWMKSYGVTIQMKATEQYFPVMVLFIMQCKVVLTFEFVTKSCGLTIQLKHGAINFVFLQKFYEIKFGICNC